MDSSEGGGGDGGGGEERDADLSPQALSLPLLTLAVSPEQGSSSHTSATAPAKEPPTLLQQQEEEGAGGSQAREETQEGEQKEGGRDSQENGVCQKQGMKEDFGEGYLSGQRKEEGGMHVGVGEASVTVGLPAALNGEEEKEEEEAISNQSQTKSKCSLLLPQQSQHSSSSSTAKASGTLDSKTAASPKPSPFLSTSPKHFTCPYSSSALLSETEVKDIKGDQGWISGFPQSFKSQQSTLAFPLAGTEPASTPAEDDGPAGVSHSSISNGDGAKAPEPNDSQLDTEVDDERDKEGEKDAVHKNLNQDLSPNSLTSHMTIMHSRNSCKTLKCPKCNWHYKSQHTLQVHMKEKHPETGGQCVCSAPGGKCVCGGATRDVCGYCSSGKPHPRLARGETYACGYKPYRCEVCDYATSSKGNLSIHMQSDKHLNNVQNGGHSNSHLPTSQIANNSSSSNGHTVEEPAYKLPLSIPTPTVQPAKLTPPAHSHSHGKRWRCDVCDYETSIARNLRIHTTSEKHTHNMLRLQRGYYLSHCRSLAPQLKHLQNTGAELSLNMRLTSQQVAEQPVTLGSTLTPSPSPSPSPPPAPSLSPTGPLSQGVFQCLVCSCFSSDSLESVEQHLNTTRSLPQSEWCSLVAGGCHCRLCGYTTPLRANFSLHCQTDRHRTRYQLAAHLQEGGDRGQEGAALIAKGNPVQLRCNLCDYVTSSLEKLRGHSLSSHHKASVRVYRFLQQYDEEVDGGSWLFHCLLCNHSSSSKLQVLKHSQTPTHQQREGLLQLQPMGGEELAAIFTIRKSPDGDQGELSEDMETSREITTGHLDTTKDKSILISKKTENKEEENELREFLPSVKRSSSGYEELEIAMSTKRPRLHQQNENQQTVQCPLCQVKLPYKHLQQHLTHVHSVAQDCVDKLISTVTPLIEQLPRLVQTEPLPALCVDESQTNKTPKSNSENCSNSATIAPVDSQKDKGISAENSEGEVAAPKDVTALLTPPLEDNTTHHSNGRLAPQSPTQIPPSSPPSSPASDPPPLSDRHGYRFRCSRCSLAFPTQEKLQLHWQYHAMRAATECPICSRQCRSQEALQRHMQNTHSQLDNTQGQNTLLPPHPTQYMELNKSSCQQDLSLSPQVGQEAGEAEDEDMEEEEEEEEEEEALDINGKEETKEVVKFKERKVAGEIEGSEEELTELEKGQQEEIISEPSSSSPVKKSSNPTMDRYLDPTRPYKCTICSESFTQKTILLVHFNSVSHLHRARRALQDSGTGAAASEAPRGPDPRPYRCRLCGVGYSQSSTLDIHLRSVLHQTRARAAQNSAPQIPASSIAVPVTASSTPTQAATTREEKTSSNLSLMKRPDVVGCSSSSSVVSGLPTENQATTLNTGDNPQAKKRVAELLASRNQLMLLQQQQLVHAQAQAQAQLQQHTALLQSQLIQHLPLGPENLLKHFPLAPENLLTLQQQLLLPFYLSGDMKLTPELAVKNQELGQPITDDSIPNAQAEAEPKRDSQPKITEKQIQRQNSNPAFSQPKDHVHCEAIAEAGCSGSSSNQTEKQLNSSGLEEEKEEMPVVTIKIESEKKETDPSCNVLSLQCPPPRIPYAAVNGEPLRALLQSYGFELALQYIQSRHRHQQQISAHMIPNTQACSDKEKEVLPDEERDKVIGLQDYRMEGCNNNNDGAQVNGGMEDLPQEKGQKKDEELPKKEKECCDHGEKCRHCGKFFSDALILKSHQEYIHRSLFPTDALERFSREYRQQYDQMYPLPQPKSADDLSTCPQAATPASSSDSEPAGEPVKPQVKARAPSTVPLVSEPITKSCTPATDPSPTAPLPSSPIPSHTQDFHQEALNPSTSATATAHTTSQATAIPLPLPMLPLSLPQLPMPSLTLPKLPLPPIPFPMELPLLPPVVMQSVALQSKPWLDSNVNPELAKLYQSQLNQAALLGQQPQLNPTLVPQQSQLSPALQIQPPQLNPVLLGQKTQSNPIQTGQQPQVSPTILEQGKRTRTRITEEQLTVLRKHFDINSLPSDEEINKMSSLCGLPHKVIKHWFRNTLFKERQRDKDSPYNFNNPPVTALEESSKESAQTQPFSLSPCSLSPSLPATNSPQPQTADIQREELHKGRRSSRTRFTEQQLETLQGVFEATPYPREEEYDRLSALLSLPNRVIVVWFQNARQRARKNQDRVTDDGLEGKNHYDNTYRHKNGCNNNEDDDNDGNSCGEGQQSELHNENSMDLTYEYYTHPDSPFVGSSSPCPESEHPTEKGEQTPVTKKQEDKTVPSLENKSTTLGQTQSKNSDVDIQRKDIVLALKTGSSPKSEPNLQPENTAERPAACSSSSQKMEPTSLAALSSQAPLHSSLSDQTSDPAPSLPAPQEPEKSHLQMSDSSSSLSSDVQPKKQLQPQTQAQFQCSLCPMSLPSFQLWQEHQTRHLLAAQSQVQFLHSGFADRSMPYMMLHPNHTLMASQMLSGAIPQMHPNPTHPMMSHLNSIQIKNTFSDHSSTALTSLSQSSLTNIKQNSKILSESSFESQRSGREVEEEHRRDKRQRTTITPEQLEVLYQRYSMDSNPTRGVLESIARDVGLTRRVVQVWFQNTRARERKGQFRSVGPGSNFSLGFNHLRCPFCRALFKVKSALDAHMRSRHWAEAERAGYNLSMNNGSSGQIGMAMSSILDRPGPSVSNPKHGFAISNKELIVRPPMNSMSSNSDLNNPEEEDDYEEDEEEYQCEEGSSLADQGSLSPEGSGGPGADWDDTQTLQQQNQQQQRQRTQMSHYQILQLRDFYRNHRNPNRHECEALGQELGLPHRVVQVWFQNARAKEKRARSLSSDAAEREQAELSAGAGERDRA